MRNDVAKIPVICASGPERRSEATHKEVGFWVLGPQKNFKILNLLK